jgi:putative nucleotidyltransferase with HDIG domain
MSSVTPESASLALPKGLRDALVQRVRENRLELPVLPEVANRVITLTMDDACELAQLSGVIQRDQSLTAHLLRIANSALYAPPSPIVSLSQALARLGMTNVREIALLISCEGRVFKVDGFDLRVRAAFKHSIAAAAWAQELARMRRWNVEEAFLCGLLSDVGRPVVLQALVDIKNEYGFECPREAMEQAAQEFHCQVGAALVKSWKLPARLSETILYHHDPENAPTSSQTAILTRLAADFAHWTVGPRKVAEAELRAHPMIVPLNIYPEEMDTLVAMRERIKTAVESVA